MLTSSERKALIAALFLLPLTALMVRLYGFQRTKEKFTPGHVQHRGRDPSAELTHGYEIARMVNIAACRGVFKFNCLTRSLVLFYLLRRQGLSCQLAIGAQLRESRFSAHAWVELYGTPLNDTENVGVVFSAFNMTGNRSKP